MFDASGGLFLLIKLLYDSGVPLNQVIYGYSALFVMTWLKCFFLTPNNFAIESKLSSYELSVMGQCFNKQAVDEKQEVKQDKTLKDFKCIMRESVCSVPYLMFVIFISIITTRCSSIPAWIHPWLEWTFYDRSSVETEVFLLVVHAGQPSSKR